MTVQMPKSVSQLIEPKPEAQVLASNINKIADANFGQSFSNNDAFSKLDKAECRFLFQFPSLLIGQESERAAAILCREDGEMRLVFLVLNSDRSGIDIYGEDDVSEHLANFTWSFANILSVLPQNKKLTSQ